MTLACTGTAYCRGCGAPVYVYRDHASGRDVVRDGARFGVPESRHLCADPARREQIDLGDPRAVVLAVCPDCGDPGVAWSSWGRLVECPYPSWTSRLWDEPYEAHVCIPGRVLGRVHGSQGQATRSTSAAIASVDVPDL